MVKLKVRVIMNLGVELTYNEFTRPFIEKKEDT